MKNVTSHKNQRNVETYSNASLLTGMLMVFKLYEKISEEVKQDYYQQNFKNDGERFVAWYLRNIHLRDPNQTKYNITDGQNDKQIDAIVVNDDTSVAYIVQGKFIGESTVDSEPLREVLSS